MGIESTFACSRVIDCENSNALTGDSDELIALSGDRSRFVVTDPQYNIHQAAPLHAVKLYR